MGAIAGTYCLLLKERSIQYRRSILSFRGLECERSRQNFRIFVDVRLMDYTVRLAEKTDLAALPEIERAAAQLFRPYVAWLEVPITVLESLTTPGFLLRAQADSRLWVSAVCGRPVGFIVAKFLSDSCFIVELDVHPDYGRHGMGSALVKACCAHALAQGFEQVILTTFRRVPWNIPFYQRLGFEVLPSEAWPWDIAAIVDHETRYGFLPEKRAVMRRMMSLEAEAYASNADKATASGAAASTVLLKQAAEKGWTDGR